MRSMTQIDILKKERNKRMKYEIEISDDHANALKATAEKWGIKPNVAGLAAGLLHSTIESQVIPALKKETNVVQFGKGEY